MSISVGDGFPVFNEEKSGLVYRWWEHHVLALLTLFLDDHVRVLVCADVSVRMQAGGNCHNSNMFTARRNRSVRL